MSSLVCGHDNILVSYSLNNYQWFCNCLLLYMQISIAFLCVKFQGNQIMCLCQVLKRKETMQTNFWKFVSQKHLVWFNWMWSTDSGGNYHSKYFSLHDTLPCVLMPCIKHLTHIRWCTTHTMQTLWQTYYKSNRFKIFCTPKYFQVIYQMSWFWWWSLFL